VAKRLVGRRALSSWASGSGVDAAGVSCGLGLGLLAWSWACAAALALSSVLAGVVNSLSVRAVSNCASGVVVGSSRKTESVLVSVAAEAAKSVIGDCACKALLCLGRLSSSGSAMEPVRDSGTSLPAKETPGV
jgi:hypothetical protein